MENHKVNTKIETLEVERNDSFSSQPLNVAKPYVNPALRVLNAARHAVVMCFCLALVIAGLASTAHATTPDPATDITALAGDGTTVFGLGYTIALALLAFATIRTIWKKSIRT